LPWNEGQVFTTAAVARWFSVKNEEPSQPVGSKRHASRIAPMLGPPMATHWYACATCECPSTDTYALKAEGAARAAPSCFASMLR
jgi:hypothetical protein